MKGRSWYNVTNKTDTQYFNYLYGMHPVVYLLDNIYTTTFTMKQNKHYCANICFLCVCYATTCFDLFIWSSSGVFNLFYCKKLLCRLTN
jgi:hypothetical protein